MTLLAVTGATGFIGRHLLREAAAIGFEVRALTRRDQPPAPGVEWVAGDLDDRPALTRLCAGAEAVIHVAGVINAPDRAGFERGNVGGTLNMLRAARDTGVRRFVHVSSLAAREPDLSDYGRSKARSERMVAASSLGWTIVRPPAVYGPGDREMLEMFRMARRGIVALPPGGRLSVIAAEDLARLLLVAAVTPDMAGALYEPDDCRPGGWSHYEFAHALGAAFGRGVRPVALPASLLRFGAWADGVVRRRGAKLTPDRVRYFCHPDWVAGEPHHPPAGLWRPLVPTPAGLKATADWYRAQKWL